MSDKGDVTEFSKRLLNAFPNATDDDVRLTWDLAKAYDASVQGAAIDGHRLEQGSRVWRPDPRAIAAICRRMAPPDMPRVDSAFVARTSSELARWRQADAIAEADAERVDQCIAAIDDDELERLKAAVLERQNDFVRKALANKDARLDRRLKSLIVNHVDQHGTVAA
jgi:hypothetical protein